MTNSQIEKFLFQRKSPNPPVEITFKVRESITGVFILSSDYEDLKSKNFWRVVELINLEEYNNTNNSGLVRMFNGVSIASLKFIKTVAVKKEASV